MQTIWVERLVNEDNQWQWKAFPENINTEQDFAINEDNLNGEICKMGQLLARYGFLAAEMSANLKRVEENVKFVRAKIATAVRSEAETKNEKLSENKIDERVTLEAQYQKSLSKLHIFRADCLKIEHWYRSLTKKADLIIALVYKQNAEIRRMPG